MTASELEQLSNFTRVAVISDTQGPENPLSVFQTIAAAVLSHNPAVIFHAGDLVETGGDYATAFLAPLSPFALANIQPVPGNHDDNTDSLAAFFTAFPHLSDTAYWQRAVGRFLRVYGLNSSGIIDTDLSSTGPQAVWLTEQAALFPEQWKIVVTHKPAYTNNSQHAGEVTLRWGDAVGEPFQHIDFHMSGHVHGYERLEVASVVYIAGLSGRGQISTVTYTGTTNTKFQSATHGFCIIDANAFMLRMRYYDITNTLLDEVVLRDSYSGISNESMAYTFTRTDGLASNLVARSSPGKLYSFWGVNTNVAAAQYIQVWDEAAVADIDGASTLLHAQVSGNTNGAENFSFYATQDHEIRGSKGLCVVNSTTLTTYTAGAADCLIFAKTT